MDFDSNAPIYYQLVNIFKKKIVSAELKRGEKISSVRDLALKYSVNPNTVQKALAQLEHEKLVFAERTNGRFVTENEGLIKDLRTQLLEQEINRFFEEIQLLGYNKNDIIQYLSKREV